MTSQRYGSSAADTTSLARPLQFEPSGRVAKNRFMKAPMGEGLASWSPRVHHDRGIPTDELVELYRRWGEGENGWGVIITGNVETDFQSISASGDMIITTDCKPGGKRFEMFKKIAAVGKASGSLMIAQITHPGAKVQYKLNPVAISASEVSPEGKNGVKYGKPHAATRQEIARLIEGFAYAAEYLEKAGFDGIELHAAHGYLLSQFLSPLTNHRTDEYGAQTTESRLKFISEVAKAIKARVSPKFIVSAKLNSFEFQDGGVTDQEAKELCEALESIGFDFVELSGGTSENGGMEWTKESTRRREAFFLEWAAKITSALRPGTKLKVYLTGGFRSAAAMVEGLDTVDGIGLGRPAATEPYLCRDILEGRVLGAIRPVQDFENDFAGGLAIAGAQLAQIGNGKVPLDYGDEKVMEILKDDMKLWQQKTIEDGDKLEYVLPPRYSGPQFGYEALAG
ncbi:nadh oxidase [Seiridium cupressi]